MFAYLSLMQSARILDMRKRIAFISILIGLLFFLNSSQYLSWFYILANFFDAAQVDFFGQFLGELFQGLGVLCFSGYIYFSKRKPNRIVEFASLLVLTYIFSVLAIVPESPFACLIFGLLMNIAIGLLFAWYTYIIIYIVPQEHFGISFGTGIGISCLFSFLLYKSNPDYSFVTSAACLYLYAFTAIISIIILIAQASLISDEPYGYSLDANSLSPLENPKKGIAYLFLFLFMASVVFGMGYFVPSQDLQTFNISVEVMRVAYCISLIIAGIVNDYSRKHGLILSLVTIAFTFSMPLMRENTPGVYIAWVASYLLGGLISVFRAVAFLDTANENQLFYLAPMGLFIGRVGESVGYLIRTRLFNNYVVLLLIISVFFALAIVLFALVYSFAYLKPEANALPEIDYHASFVGRYQLSTREIQILDEILSGKANKEIAAILFITEATVKFHVKNLLQKTNCKNRNELTKLYNDGNNSL